MKTLKNRRLRKKGGWFWSKPSTPTPTSSNITRWRTAKASLGMKGKAIFTNEAFDSNRRESDIVQGEKERAASEMMNNEVYGLFSSQYATDLKLLLDLSDIVLDSVLTGKNITTYPKYGLIAGFSKTYNINADSESGSVQGMLRPRAMQNIKHSIFTTRSRYDPVNNYTGTFIDPETASPYIRDFIKKFDANPKLVAEYGPYIKASSELYNLHRTKWEKDIEEWKKRQQMATAPPLAEEDPTPPSGGKRKTRKKGAALFYRLPAEWRPIPGYQFDGYDETISGPVPFSWALFSQKTGRRLNIRSGDKGRYYINYPVKNTKADDVVDKLPQVYCTKNIPDFKIFDQADFTRILQLCPPKTAEQQAKEQALTKEKYDANLKIEQEKREKRMAAMKTQ